jgi:hypothetical protein
MSSRQEEKQRRREERERREREEAQRASTGRRMRLVGAAVAGVVLVAVIVVVAISAAGGDGDGKPQTKASATKPIPAARISDLDAAARAAGCTVREYPSEGREHLPSDTQTNDKYKTNPPSSGNHRPTAAQDGSYSPGNEPAKENAVHALEHGRIEIQYRSGTPPAQIAQLQTLFNEPLKGVAGYHQLLFQNNTDMASDIAAVAWTRVMRCGTYNDKIFDAVRAFRTRFVDKGPEIIP